MEVKAFNTNVAGAGLKSCISDRKIPIALHNRFQMLDMFNEVYKACDKVEYQRVLLGNDDNMPDTSSDLQGTVKIPEKHLGDENKIPSLKVSEKAFHWEKNKTGLSRRDSRLSALQRVQNKYSGPTAE